MLSSRAKDISRHDAECGDLAFADAPAPVAERAADFVVSPPLAPQAADARTPGPQERRRTGRYPTFQGARIVGDGREPIDCVVRNLSKTGACLQVATAVGVPERFALRYKPGRAVDCHVVWRKQRLLGVEFKWDPG